MERREEKAIVDLQLLAMQSTISGSTGLRFDIDLNIIYMQQVTGSKFTGSASTAWRLIRSWALIALGVLIAAHTSRGISYESNGSLVAAVIIISLLNMFLRPLLLLFTLPLVILTLGIGLIIINAFIIYLTSAIVPGFDVATYWSALWAAVVVAVCTLLVNLFVGGRRVTIRVDRVWGPNAGDGKKGIGSEDDVIDV